MPPETPYPWRGGGPDGDPAPPDPGGTRFPWAGILVVCVLIGVGVALGAWYVQQHRGGDHYTASASDASAPNASAHNAGDNTRGDAGTGRVTPAGEKVGDFREPGRDPSNNNGPAPDKRQTSDGGQGADPSAGLKIIEPGGVKRLPPPRAYEPRDNTIIVELSQYAGYAGLVVANGGLEPNDQSLYFKKYGFKVKFTLSEEESWPALQAGKMAASATTADVLAVYGKQFDVVVPAQIGYSRGADGIVVRSNIARINDLKGKVIVTSQFTESDFFIRYLAQEASLPVHLLKALDEPPDPGQLNLVFCADGESAGKIFLRDVQSGANQLAGCVTWEPTTSQVLADAGGKARLLVSNRNLLIVADILIVNRGFARARPKMVAGLVEGLLEGNRLVRDHPERYYGVIGRAFKWDEAQARDELGKVHLANLPENLAFFSGAIDTAGSFESIYSSAVISYGKELIPNPVDSEQFVELRYLKELEQSGAFQGQKVDIAPIRAGKGGEGDGDPLLTKNIRFLFERNSTTLDLSNGDNLKNLDALRQMLRVSPGSRLMLRGHVDNSRADSFRRQGTEVLRSMTLAAMQLSKDRAREIKRLLIERSGVPEERVETVGRGWEEPISGDPEQNRRVEAQWFTVE